MNDLIRLGRKRRKRFMRFKAYLQPGRGSLILAGLCCLCTVLAHSVPAISHQFVIGPGTIPDARIIAIGANTFTAVPSSFFGLLILVALGAYFFWDAIKGAWARKPTPIIVAVGSVVLLIYGVNQILGKGVAEGLIADVGLLLWFGTVVERLWGIQRFLTFSLVVVSVVNLVGAHVAWLWPSSFAPLLEGSGMPVAGAGPLIDALMTVWCLMHARQRLAILNIEAGKLVWVLVAINVLELILRGFLSGLMGLLAIGLAKLLVSGNWRPRTFMDRLRLWWIEHRISRRRQKIHLVDDDRTLHRTRTSPSGAPSKCPM